MARRKREADPFTMSFLDIMCCGFGAIILLMMISKFAPEEGEPGSLEVSETLTTGTVLDRQKQLFAIRGQTNVFNRDLNARHEQLSEYNERIARLRGEMNRLTARVKATEAEDSKDKSREGDLEVARQSLTDEMKRLQASLGEQIDTESVGGVPVDSEYIIFIIDTSGSMFNYSWNRMMEAMQETLRVYPTVKGIQVMSDEGDYMFSSFRNQWIPDSPARRTAIMTRLRTWNPFSDSSPVEGIIAAIRTFYDPDKKISLYVLGDDFSGNSIAEVVATVDRINASTANGERLVRIHGIGFPTIFSQPRRYQAGAFRFSALMRELARKNGGTFVGLDDFY